MNIEITRGRSEIYDILTHLTFLFIESHKIKDRVLLNSNESVSREWTNLEDVITNQKTLTDKQREIIYVHLGNILGRTYEEIVSAYNTFTSSENPNRFFYLFFI